MGGNHARDSNIASPPNFNSSRRERANRQQRLTAGFLSSQVSLIRRGVVPVHITARDPEKEITFLGQSVWHALSEQIASQTWFCSLPVATLWRRD